MDLPAILLVSISRSAYNGCSDLHGLKGTVVTPGTLGRRQLFVIRALAERLVEQWNQVVLAVLRLVRPLPFVHLIDLSH